MRKPLSTKKKFSILLVAVFVGVASMWVWHAMQLREPLYDGKSVSYWLRHPIMRPMVVSIIPPPASVITNVEFPHMDSNAVPALRQALYAKDSEFEKACEYAWNIFPRPLQGLLPKPVRASLIQGRAAHLLARMAYDYPPAMAAVIEASKSPVVRNAVAGDLLVYPNSQPVHQFLNPFEILTQPKGQSSFYGDKHFQDSTDLWSPLARAETHSYGLPVPSPPRTN